MAVLSCLGEAWRTNFLGGTNEEAMPDAKGIVSEILGKNPALKMADVAGTPRSPMVVLETGVHGCSEQILAGRASGRSTSGKRGQAPHSGSAPIVRQPCGGRRSFEIHAARDEMSTAAKNLSSGCC